VTIRAVDRKLLRDLWRIRGQVVAISLVIGAGIAMFLLLLSAFASLDLTQREYYQRERFGHVFASLTRAPQWVAEDISSIPGVTQVQTRVVADVTLDVPGLDEPATGHFVSVPEGARPAVNDLALSRGRWVSRDRPDDVIVNRTFADANHLDLGDAFSAVLNGRRRRLRIVGIALSPEFVYTIRPGEVVTDEHLYGVVWMGRRALGEAFDLEGAFNDVSLRVAPGASVPEVISRLDRLLEPWGGTGAIPRSLQPSNFYLQSELDGLKSFGSLIPLIFLGVAAFLLNVVLSRTVTLQREQIAAMKALGYSNREVALHYVKWGLVVAGLGAVMGLAAGAWLGAGLTRIYTEFYKFPILRYRLPLSLVAQALGAALFGAVLGALGAVRQAVKLPPAEAMRPEPPASFRRSLVERLGLGRLLSQPARMIVRHLQRRPARAAVSVLGIALGGAILIAGTFSMDSMNTILDREFFQARRQDATVAFVEPTSPSALDDVRHLPGVLIAEPYRAVSVRIHHGHRSRTTAITGLPQASNLNRVVDQHGDVVPVPRRGLLLSAKLAQILKVRPGDSVRVEVLEGRRPVLELPVESLVHDLVGTNVYMSLSELHRRLEEGDVLSGAYLMVDEKHLEDLYSAVKSLPQVAGVSLRRAAVESFRNTLMESFAVMRTVSLVFAAIIAAGVVYNTARVSLSERRRELATLRIIGLTRGEISYILLGELAVITLVAVPLGLALGYAMAAGMVKVYDTEAFRMPLTVARSTLVWSAVTVLVSSVLSALWVRRKLDRLDLIAVLKTRE